MLVYVISARGHPLMPTSRGGRVRHLLNEKKATIVKMKPFTIKLNYETQEITQPLMGGTDPGRTNIGEAVINQKGETVYEAHVTTRNKDIKKLMTDRKEHRQASRRGERKRRQRRAKKNNTCFTEKERILPGCEKPIKCKYIINTEARFNNRKRPKGWLTPTVRQLVDTHLHMVDQIRSILPVENWVLEYNAFALMLFKNPKAKGKDFQNGRLKGYSSPHDYVYQEQKGKCACCSNPIAIYHHIVERHDGGSDLPENLLGLCLECHGKLHTQRMKDKIAKLGEKKRLAALSVLNQAIPYIYKGLVERFGEEHVLVCRGYDTSALRKMVFLTKKHSVDAACIAAIGFGTRPVLKEAPYEIQQFRRHDRAIIQKQNERTYRVNGNIVAKNRKRRFSQKDYPGFDEYLHSITKTERMALRKTLTVEKSKRYYNNINRPYLPGCIFLYKGKRYIMKGQVTDGEYLTAIGAKRLNKKGKVVDTLFPIKRCKVIQTGGLVYL